MTTTTAASHFTSFRSATNLTQTRDGFTLIELLVVVLIIAILLAVALPSFLGQTQKAQESVAKQQLYNVYIDGRGIWASNSQALPATTSFVAQLSSAEPQLTFSADGGFPTAGLGQINTVVDSTGNVAEYRATAADGRQFLLIDNTAAVGNQLTELAGPTNGTPLLPSVSANLATDGTFSGTTDWTNNSSAGDTPSITVGTDPASGNSALDFSVAYQGGAGNHTEAQSPYQALPGNGCYSTLFTGDVAQMPSGDGVAAVMTFYSSAGTNLGSSVSTLATGTGTGSWETTDCYTGASTVAKAKVTLQAGGAEAGQIQYFLDEAYITSAGNTSYSNSTSW